VTLQLQLDRLGRRLKRWRVARSFLRWLSLTLGLWLLWFWLDNLLRLPAGIRLAMLGVGLAVPVWRALQEWLRPACRPVSPARTAREIENRCGIRDNTLINACCFEQTPPEGAAGAFAWRARKVGLACAANIHPEQLFDRRALRRAGAVASVGLLIWGAYVLLLSRHAGNAFARLIMPLADIPPVTSVTVSLSPSRTVTLWAGDSLVVTAQLRAVTGRLESFNESPVLRQTQREGLREASVDLPMAAVPGAPGCHVRRFEAVREPFTCNAQFGDTWSRTLTVQVRHPPRITASAFELIPPSYAGTGTTMQAGAPMPLRVLAGSRARVSVTLDRAPQCLLWRQGGAQHALAQAGTGEWQAEVALEQGGDYLLMAGGGSEAETRPVARGEVVLLPDRTPEVALVAASRNQRVWSGAKLALPVEAGDDFGLQAVWVTAAPVAAPPERAEGVGALALCRAAGTAGQCARAPGADARSGALPPRRELPPRGARARLESRRYGRGLGTARDPHTAARRGRGTARGGGTGGGPCAGAGGGRATACAGTDAQPRGASGRGTVTPAHRCAPRKHRQGAGVGTQAWPQRCRSPRKGRRAGGYPRAAVAAGGAGDGAGAGAHHGARTACGDLRSDAAARRASGGHQNYILNELLSLLGRLAAQARLAQERDGGATAPPMATDADRARDLQEFLKDFAAVQKRIVEQTRSLLERGPEDLTEEELEILGQLAREEGKWAALLRDRLDDLAKNPLQDFADGSMAEAFNEVWQDVQKAAESLYARKIEMAVPQEQGGLENAEELIHNLERWLTDKPDYIKWLMEEPPTPAGRPAGGAAARARGYCRGTAGRGVGHDRGCRGRHQRLDRLARQGGRGGTPWTGRSLAWAPRA
jgi:hypothetical protein